MIVTVSIICFLIAIGLSSIVAIPLGLGFGLFLGSILSLLYLFFVRHDEKRKKFSLLVIFACLSFSFGLLRFNFHLLDLHDSQFLQNNGNVENLEIVIIEPPRLSGFNIRAAGIIEGDKVLLIFPKESKMAYGDKVKVSGNVELPEAFENENGITFDYPKYLLAQGITHTLEVKSFEVISHNHAPLIRVFLYELRDKLIGAINDLIPNPDAGLLSGITLGDKNGLEKELKDQMIKVGVIHIAVFSGQNVAILSIILFALFWFLPYKFRIFPSFFFVLAFVLLSGAEQPAVRAGIFASALLLSKLIHREISNFRLLILAAFLMVFWNPLSLIYEISFQLSFLAMIGILYIAPIIEKIINNKIPWLSDGWGIRTLISATLGAQLAVLPMILHMSGNFSIWSLPANLLILPTIFVLMFGALIVSVLQAIVSIWEIVLWPLGLILQVFTSYIIFIVGFFANLTGQMTITLSTFWMIIIYLILFGIIIWLWRIFPPKETN